MQEEYWIWSSVQFYLVTHTDCTADHGLLPVLISVCKVPGVVRDRGTVTAPSFASPTSLWEVQCLLLAAAAVPGKSRLALERIVKDLGEFNTSFRIKELIPVTLPCINEVVEQKPGAFPKQQNTVCDFALLPLLVLQWGFPVISCLFSTLLVFPFSTTVGLTGWGVIRLLPHPGSKDKEESEL